MDKKCETLMDNAYVLNSSMIKRKIYLVSFRIEKFTIHGVDAKGVVVCDKSGLVLTSNKQIL